MPNLTPTPNQLAAVHACLDRLSAGAPLVALRGLAGTGKTALLPYLRRLIQAHGHATVVGTPTNRAAMVARAKGVKDVQTIHSLCFVPYFDDPYTRAKQWLEAYPGGPVDVSVWPALIRLAFEAPGMSLAVSELFAVPKDVRMPERQPDAFLTTMAHTCHAYSADKALRSVGICAEEHFAGFGPREPQNAILLIDEASMVGAEALAKVQAVYGQIVLIGDPGQLPPVADAAILETVPGAELTEIHRQAEHSPLIHLAHHFRAGGLVTRAKLQEYAPDAGWATALLATLFRDAPLLVWRNSERIACTLRIRARLGYQPHMLAVGEPLVCRVNARQPYGVRWQGQTYTARTARGEWSQEPFCNNACYHVTAVHDARVVTLQDDLTGDIYPYVRVHMEETDGTREHPESTRCRWGYCLTAHTAQGGEWETVVLSVPELRCMGDMVRKGRLGGEEAIRWRYTAVTRARERVIFLEGHRFE